MDRTPDHRGVPRDEVPHYLVRDQDRVYGVAVTRRLRAMGIRDKPIAAGSPWQNGFAERLIGSIRRECTDHIVALNEGHLLRVLRSYARYYNEMRTHRSLDKDPPVRDRFSGLDASYRVRFLRTSSPICAGLGFRYTQVLRIARINKVAGRVGKL